MADILKKRYNLVDLKISLQTSQEEAWVQFELEVSQSQETENIGKWTYPLERIGLSKRLGQHQVNPQFFLPDDMLKELHSKLIEEAEIEGPLWLHLVRPYGFLGVVHWEALLQPIIRVPILRLPNFIVPPPLESASSLDVLLCASAPIAKGQFELIESIVPIIDSVRASGIRRTRIHLFTDRAVHEQLRSQDLSGVELYSGDSAEKYASPERSTAVPDTGRIENPWLLWIKESLGPRSIDVAHFVCHGYLAADRGALAFAESPLLNEDRRIARFVGSSELVTFLTQIGAWGAAFGSPQTNFSPMGLRLFADTMAQLRPLTVLYHDMSALKDPSALCQAYRFLFSRTPEQPPLAASMFMYCQPYKVPGVVQARFTPFSDPDLEPGAELRNYFETEDNIPAWVAASQRYIDETKWKIRRLEQNSRPNNAQQRQVSEMRASLTKIQQAVGNALKIGKGSM